MEAVNIAQLFLFLSLLLNLVVTTVAWRLTRPMPGMKEWAVSAGLLALGGVFSLLGSRLGSQFLLWVQNVLLIGGLAMLVVGLNAFLSLRRQRLRLLAWMVGTSLLFAIFHFVYESFQWRVALFSMFFAVGSAWVAYRLSAAEARFHGAPRSLSIACWLGLALGLAFRGVLAALGLGIDPSSPFQGATYLIAHVVMPICISAGYVSLILLTVQRLVGERREAEAEARALAEQFRIQARTDSLTGVLNRRSFFERMQLEESRRDREGMLVAVLMLDLDHFKRLNDTHGHAAGDQALRALGSTVTPLLRPTDVFARIGGEEFAIALVGAQPETAVEVAERIRQAIHAIRVDADGANVSISASIGISRWTGSGTEGLEAALAQADAALYRAKQRGRDRVEVEESDL